MNKGFRLYLQKDMNESDKEISKKFLDNFAEKTMSNPAWRFMGARAMGGYTSGLWRGRFGIQIDYWPEYKTSKPVAFRRIAQNSRKFACVYEDTLVVKNDSYLDRGHDAYRNIVPDGNIPEMCKCGRHKGSICVDWINKPDFELYREEGQYKG